MEILRYEDMSRETWDAYISELPGAVFNLTSDNIEFIMKYSLHHVANESFLMLLNHKVCGAAIICIEKNPVKNRNQISWEDRYCPAPYLNREIPYKTLEKLMKETMGKILFIAGQNQVKLIKFAIDPLINPAHTAIFYNYNYMMKYNFLDDTTMTQILDLRRSEEELWVDVKSSFKRYIRKGCIYKLEWYDSNTITKDKIELYKYIYEKDAGKITRNSELALYYYDFIKNGNGVIGFAKKNNDYIAVIIATIYKDTAYYSSYAELEEKLEGVPAGHIMQWELIKYLKDQGVCFYEIGEQEYGKTHYHEPDKKNLNISQFKRGFGGYTTAHYKGIFSFDDNQIL